MAAASSSTKRKSADEIPRPHPADSQPPSRSKPAQWGDLWYASDCSGLDAAAIALRRSTSFRHWFGSEIKDSYRKVFIAIHPECEHVFQDMQARCLDSLVAERKAHPTNPLVYTSGFPCQPYSKEGLGRGMGDSRAPVVWSVLLTISLLMPDIFILENVEDLVRDQRFQEVFLEILNMLVQIGDRAYFIDWQVLDSNDFGVPATRRRVYVVGVLKAKLAKKWEWPKPQPRPSLKSILVPRKKGEEKDMKSLNQTALQNLATAFQKIATKDGTWKTQPWVIDCQNSASRGVNISFDRFATITRSHANHLWLVCKNDFAKPIELLAAQGILQEDLPIRIDAFPPATIGEMAGNSFTATVMKCLLDTLLEAIAYF